MASSPEHEGMARRSHRPFAIADKTPVWDAAVGPSCRGRIVRGRARRVPVVEMWRDGDVSVRGETTNYLPCRLIPPPAYGG